MSRPTIASAAAALLRERRAMTSEELGREIAAAGLTRSRHPTQATSNALNLDGRFRRASDGRWTMPAELLRGVTLTHRLSGAARASDVLPLGADLAPLMLAHPALLRLPDGGALELLWGRAALSATDEAADNALRGPAGWLPAVGPRQLLHVRVSDGKVLLEPGPEPPPKARMAARRIVEAARRRLDVAARDDPWFPPVAFVDPLVLDLLIAEPDLFAEPIAPLGEVFAAAGLEVRRSWVGMPGTGTRRPDAPAGPGCPGRPSTPRGPARRYGMDAAPGIGRPWRHERGPDPNTPGAASASRVSRPRGERVQSSARCCQRRPWGTKAAKSASRVMQGISIDQSSRSESSCSRTALNSPGSCRTPSPAPATWSKGEPPELQGR